MPTRKSIPKFENEDQERAYWAKHSPLDHFAVSTAGRAKFPNLKPSLRSISIRLPESMLDDLKRLANKQDVPYQSLAKVFLAREIRRTQGGIS